MQRSSERWAADQVLAVFQLRIARLDVGSAARLGDREYVARMIGIVRALAAEAGWSAEELAHAIRLRVQPRAPAARIVRES
jgi:hypothetical protein